MVQKYKLCIPKYFLLDADLKTNITFEKNHKKINSEKLLHSIEVANLKDKIFSLKDKLDEYVGTDGIRLSGGEKQRIALARAIYSDKDILFLDEFTSALDKETEEKIFNNLTNYKKENYYHNNTPRDDN